MTSKPINQYASQTLPCPTFPLCAIFLFIAQQNNIPIVQVIINVTLFQQFLAEVQQYSPIDSYPT